MIVLLVCLFVCARVFVCVRRVFCLVVDQRDRCCCFVYERLCACLRRLLICLVVPSMYYV